MCRPHATFERGILPLSLFLWYLQTLIYTYISLYNYHTILSSTIYYGILPKHEEQLLNLLFCIIGRSKENINRLIYNINNLNRNFSYFLLLQCIGNHIKVFNIVKIHQRVSTKCLSSQIHEACIMYFL